MNAPRRRGYLLTALGAAAVGYFLISGSAAPLIFLALAYLLWLAWRFDNHTGSLFILAIFVVLVLGVLTLLIGLAALQK